MSVTAALAAIMGELPSIGRDDTSPQGYSYRGIEAITRQLQPLLAKYGVVIVPSASIQNVVLSPEMKPNWQDVYLTVDWEIFGPDGHSITARTTGIGRDNADKGANKAQTQAYKYLLLHLLCIADRADDVDGAHYDDPVEEQGPNEVQVLYEAVKATKGTPFADELKTLAEFNQQKLTEKALADNPDWAKLVSDTLADMATRTEEKANV